MITAGLVAKKANDLGLKVPSYVKTSLAPGSKVVVDYLKNAGLLDSLADVGFKTVGLVVQLALEIVDLCQKKLVM